MRMNTPLTQVVYVQSDFSFERLMYSGLVTSYAIGMFTIIKILY